MSDRPDVLLVSLGTTRGWRLADALFLDGLRRAGARAEAVGVRVGATARLRRAYPVNDVVEALAARRAVHAALRRRSPRAVVVSTTTAAMLLPPLEQPLAVRLDGPAALNRPGARNAPLHALERRWLGRAALALPWSEAARDALPRPPARAVVVPPPVAASGPPAARRERRAVAYTPDPKAKGLDVVCAAWAAAAVPGARLELFGITRERGLAHLARHGLPEPAAVVWRGLTPPDAFRAALRGARLYLGGARWEDFGQAPLEALADGALVATVPSGGPFAALALARRLTPALVADAVDPQQLAACLRAGFELDEAAVAGLRAGAAELLAPYAPAAITATIEREVLPPLLSGR